MEIVDAVRGMGSDGRQRKNGTGRGGGNAETSSGIATSRRNPAAGSLAMPSIKRKPPLEREREEQSDGAGDGVSIASRKPPIA